MGKPPDLYWLFPMYYSTKRLLQPTPETLGTYSSFLDTSGDWIRLRTRTSDAVVPTRHNVCPSPWMRFFLRSAVIACSNDSRMRLPWR